MDNDKTKNMLEIVERLNDSQLKMEKNTLDVIHSSDASLSLVKEGIGAINNLMEKIEQLNEEIKLSRENVEHMKEVSEAIAGFAKVISGIANKTNILSLNASIEAARAGEHGRGFSVVAQEVQSLANQTKNSSAEITAKIVEVQRFVDGMVAYMNHIYVNAEEQNRMVEEIGGLLGKMLDTASAANDVSRSMEDEIAYQRNMTDQAKKTLN